MPKRKSAATRALLVIVAVNAGLGKERYYELQAREDLAKITEQNRAEIRLNVASKKDAPDNLDKLLFSSKDKAVQAAEKFGFDSISHQQIAWRAANMRKLKHAVTKKKAKKK